jgi:hypothetical protein
MLLSFALPVGDILLLAGQIDASAKYFSDTADVMPWEHVI